MWRQETRLAETGGIAFLEPDEIEQLGREDGAELDALLRFADRKHAGDEKARIARALGPVGPGLEAFAEVIDAAGRTMGVPVGRKPSTASQSAYVPARLLQPARRAARDPRRHPPPSAGAGGQARAAGF